MNTGDNLPKVPGLFAIHFLQRENSNIPSPNLAVFSQGMGNERY
jgi:hypothetical protein